MDTVTTLPWGRALTRADLVAMPDDGHRYELVDGVLLVSPSPSHRHQRAVVRLWRLLDDACPPELEALVAPFEVVLADDTVFQPDVLVARRADLEAGVEPLPLALAVEVLSPSTRRIDLLLKRARYEAAGVGAYWVVDPAEPSLTAYALAHGRYAESGRAVGGEPCAMAEPFPVTVVPAALVS